jgi:hypothetical protein
MIWASASLAFRANNAGSMNRSVRSHHIKAVEVVEIVEIAKIVGRASPQAGSVLCI